MQVLPSDEPPYIGDAIPTKERPECAILIAAILTEWARLESLLSYFYAALTVGVEPYDGTSIPILIEAYHSIHGLTPKLTIISDAATTRGMSVDSKDGLRQLFKRVRKAAEGRNRVAHSIWEIVDKHPKALIMVRLPLEFEGREIWQASDFENILEPIVKLYCDLDAFYGSTLVPELLQLVPKAGDGVIYTMPSRR